MKTMKLIISISLLLSALLLIGCSQVNQPVAPDGTATGSRIQESIRSPQLDRLSWGNWMIYVNEEHTSIEAVPVREASMHYNVLMFVEGPTCMDCLQIGPAQPQGDGTFKFDVTLKHPFPIQPLYTGFDVKGTVVFPATHYWSDAGVPGGFFPHPYAQHADEGYSVLPLYFSRSSDGGGEVLNADGYSFYLFPGYPSGDEGKIYNYQKGKYAYWDETALDSTVNPYKEFHTVDERRMFVVDTEATRTYHIKPPAGPFRFGYMLDAAWVPPMNTPVTNPATDFPEWANAEEGYILDVTQIAPVKFGFAFHEAVEITHHHKEDGFDHFREAAVYCYEIVSELDSNPICLYRYSASPPNAYGSKEQIDPWTTKATLRQYASIIDVPPGYYIGLCVTYMQYEYYSWEGYPQQAQHTMSPAFTFMDLYVEG